MAFSIRSCFYVLGPDKQPEIWENKKLLTVYVIDGGRDKKRPVIWLFLLHLIFFASHFDSHALCVTSFIPRNLVLTN